VIEPWCWRLSLVEGWMKSKLAENHEPFAALYVVVNLSQLTLFDSVIDDLVEHGSDEFRDYIGSETEDSGHVHLLLVW